MNKLHPLYALIYHDTTMLEFTEARTPYRSPGRKYEVDRQRLLERFLRYISIDTQSAEDSTSFPSTEQQWVLLRLLLDEAQGLNLQDVELDTHGYVMATVPATPGYEKVPMLGLLAHVDTSPDLTGRGVRPQILDNYNGGDIRLGQTEYHLSPDEFPELKQLVGHQLVTTNGETLLGADDKSGVAIIMTFVEYLQLHPSVSHGPIRIAFTPDEEIGRGVDFFDVKRFGALYAYTIDGGSEGELEVENFNAAGAIVVINGRNVHPGSAKGKMINALQLAHELHAMLPPEKRPEHTENYEGFFHLTELNGSVERAQMHYIIREHDQTKFEQLKRVLSLAVEYINNRFTLPPISLKIEDQYRNMGEIVSQYPQLIELPKRAMQRAGVAPRIIPIRGGTDGARLSYMGIPCPNLFTGGANFHGRYEYCSIDTMCRSVETLLHLVDLWKEEI